MTDPLAKRCRSIYQHHRKRAAADHQTLGYTAADLVLFARETRLCSYCQRLLLPESLTFDHAWPISRGGKHDLMNLLVCCAGCNEVKGKLTEPEFRELLRMLLDWHPAGQDDVMRRLRAGGAARGRLFAEGRRKKQNKLAALVEQIQNGNRS